MLPHEDAFRDVATERFKRSIKEVADGWSSQLSAKVIEEILRLFVAEKKQYDWCGECSGGRLQGMTIDDYYEEHSMISD